MPVESWTLRKYPPDKPSIILNGTDTQWPYDGSLELNHDVDIYTEAISLPTHINAKGHHVGIFASSINTLGAVDLVVSGTEGNSEPKSLSSGKDKGSDDKSTTKTAIPSGALAGGRGGNAGDVQIYVEDANLDTFKNLRISSSGGRGGNGQDTDNFDTGGLGGDGGDAGQVAVAVRTWGFTSTLNERATAILYSTDKDTEAQKRKLLEDFMTSCIRLEHPQGDKPNHSKEIAILKASLASDKGFATIMNEFRAMIGHMFRQEASAFNAVVGSGIEYSGGTYGLGGRGTKHTNSNGKTGKETIPEIGYCFLQPDLLRQLSLPIAHPDQCSMILQLAKIDYYVGSNDSLKSAIDRLTRLRDRLLFLDGLAPEEPIYKAYRDAEVRMHLLPRAQIISTSDEPIAFAGLREISAEVDALLRQIAGGFDFYGHKTDWVPRGSHSFYDKTTLEMLNHAIIAEKAWTDYRKAEKENSVKMAALREMRNQARARADAASDFITYMKPIIEASANSIGSMDFDMKQQKAELLRKIKDQTIAIGRLEPSPGIKFTDMVEAATMVAFCPDLPMVLIQGAGLVYKSQDEAKIKDDDDGESGIKRELLVKKMTTIEKGVESLVSAYRANVTDDRLAEADDPAADKLIAKKEEYMELVGNYKKALGEQSITDVEEAFESYIEAALQRNNHILMYNSTVNLILKKKQEAKASEAQAAQFSDEALATIDPDLPAISIFMERIYSESLWLLLESLSMTQRALRFWSLTQVDEIKEALKNKPPALLDSTTLSHVRTRLLKSYEKAVERAGKEPQPFSGIKYPLSATEIRRWINHPQMKTIVKIPPVFRETSSEKHPFYGKANVRLHTVRFFAKKADVDGETPLVDGETLLVKLTHLGEETIVNPSNKAFTCVHEQIKLQFQYRVKDMAFNVPGTVDGNIGEKTQGKYAMVGPFASWLVDVDPLYNTGVDLSGVTEAWFEFSGEFDSF
ncbi:hypothetical protein ACHAPJ_007397 [Fusarium lateritium]